MTAASFEQFALTKAYSPRSPHATGTSFVEANDNALPLRGLVYRAVRLAGRLALTQLRSIVHPGGTVLSAGLSDTGFVVNPTPSRVVVSVRELLSVSAGHLLAPSPEAQQTSDGVQAECTSNAEIVQRSTAQ